MKQQIKPNWSAMPSHNKPNFVARSQLYGHQLTAASLAQSPKTNVDFTPDAQTIKPKMSIPEARIKSITTPDNSIIPDIGAVVIKNIVSHAIGSGMYGDYIDGRQVLQRAGTFVISSVADGMNYPPEKVINNLPIGGYAKELIIKTGYDLLINSLIERRLPTTKDLIIFGGSEAIGPMVTNKMTLMHK